MSRVRVRFYAHLRRLSETPEISIRVPGQIRLEGFLRILAKNVKKELRSELFDDGDHIRSGLLILVNDREISALEGLDTKISDNDIVVILPFIHGGSD
ncbi:MAG: MoaD/ThiS family protein [Promethearchaeota archaeon]